MTDKRKYDWIINKSKIPYLKLDIKVPTKSISKEILDIKDHAIPQANNYNWLGTVLHGISAEKPRPSNFYGYKDEDKAPYKWTSISKYLPKTKKWIQDTFNYKKLYRVKINLLGPEGKILPHSDSKRNILGVSDKTSPINVKYITVAIQWDKNIYFNIGKYRMPIKTGDVYLINFSNLHEVYNPTRTDRYSLIITADMDNCPNWRKLIENSYAKYGNEYLKNKSSLGFLLESRLIKLPKNLLSKIIKKVRF